jgi:hypothetical protein
MGVGEEIRLGLLARIIVDSANPDRRHPDAARSRDVGAQQVSDVSGVGGAAASASSAV